MAIAGRTMRRLAGTVAAVVSLAAPGAANAEVSWRLGSVNPVGHQPRDIVIGHFASGPGADFMVANSHSNTLQWGISNGDGTFHDTGGCNTGPTFNVQASPGHLALGEWRDEVGVGEGVIAGSLGAPLVTSLAETGVGNCGFVEPYADQYYPEIGAAGIGGLSSGDVDGDRNSDSAASLEGIAAVAVARMDADGDFGDFVTVPVGATPLGNELVDLNGDGNLDLAVATYDAGRVYVALGHGDGTFSASAATPGSIPHAHSVAALEATGDGRMDLVAGNDTGVQLLEGGGDGSFEAPVLIGSGAGPAQVTAADVNGDGDGDVLVAYANQDPVQVLIGHGNGSFHPVEVEDPQISAAQSVASGDFTGDGSNDLAIVNNGSPGSVTVMLGNGDLVGPTSVGFGGQKVGVRSPVRTVNFTNTGAGTKHIVDVTIGNGDSDQFEVVSDGCSPSVRPGASCQIGVAFTPASDGAKSTDLALITEGPGVLEEVPLTGTGESPAVDVSPAAVDFGGLNVGARTPLRTVTLTNDGTADLDVSAVALTGADRGQFDLDRETCTAHPVPAGGSCQALVAFEPGSIGAKHAAVAFTDDAPAPGSSQSASLTGTGTRPELTLAPTDVEFGGADIDGAGIERTLTVTNTGSGPLRVGGVTLAGADVADFAITGNSCSEPVAAAGTCELEVTFSPTAAGDRSATIQVASDSSGSPARAALSGSGLTRLLTFSPGAASFGGVELGSRGSRSITVTNVGTGSVAVSDVAIGGAGSGAFDVAGQTCVGAPLPAGDSCAIDVEFAPRVTGPQRGFLIVDDTAAGAPHSVPLAGSGTQAGAELSRQRLSFGSKPLRKAARRSLVVTSTGTAPLQVTGVRISGPGRRSFRVGTGACGRQLAPGATCRVTVTFRPRSRGGARAVLTLLDDAPQKLSAALAGRGRKAGKGKGRDRSIWSWSPTR